MTKKICATCKEEKNTNDFRRDKTRPDGRQSWCKVCARAYHKSVYTKRYSKKVKLQNSVYRKQNMERIKNYKLRNPCLKCGETDVCCLEFHHIDPAHKDFHFNNFMRSWTSIETEIQKCVVLCSNCHNKIHANRFTI